MTYREHMQMSGRSYVEETLRAANGKASEAAKIAGVSRQDFYRLMKRYGVELPARLTRGGGNLQWHRLGVAG